MNRAGNKSRQIGTTLYGDAGTTEATVVPNLESLNTGTDAYLTSVSDTSEFNVFGRTTIVDNFWETSYATHSVNLSTFINPSVASNDTTYTIQGNTEGWLRMDHMSLLIPMTFAYNWGYIPFSSSDIFIGPPFNKNNNDWEKAYLDNVEFQWDKHSCLNNPAVVFAQDYFSTFEHAWLGCLDVFQRLRCLVGNNGQCIQSQLETEPIGLKYHMANVRAGIVLQKAINEWGMASPPSASFTETSKAGFAQIADLYTYPNIWGPNKADLVEHYECNFRNAMILQKSKNIKENSAFARMIASVGSMSNYDSRRIEFGTPDSSYWMVVTKKRNLTLPLQAIMPFFRGARYLPPDFRFKFEFNFNSSANKILERDSSLRFLMYYTPNTAQRMSVGREPECTGANVTTLADPQGVQLHYPWHVLRQPVQAAISSMWLQKPFLYNYESAQFTETMINGQSTYINFSLSVSSERPTVVDVFLFPLATDENWPKPYKSNINSLELVKANFVSGANRILNSPHNYGDFTSYENNGALKNSVDCGPCMWTEAEITFSGRTAYRLKNTALAQARGSGVDSMQPSEYILQMFEEQSFRSTATELNATCSVERGGNQNQFTCNSYTSNKLIRMIIQPGGWVDRGVISSRQGATSLGVTMSFSRPLSPLDKVVAIRLNPEQCVFDSDKNVTIVRWPAVKSNQGYLVTNISAPQ